MAINYTISYTFSPGTTISSSQVNTNFSDNANTWTGLEGLTKSFSALRVDATPTAATDVSIKSYVDKINNYRRPNLQWASVTAVNLETGINGTSGQAQILFPDGTLRTDSTTTRINFVITQNAALSGTAQSGLRTSLAEANNTYYALYAVKVSDSTTNFVTVGDTLLPTQANYASLNSNFGTNSWVYLGTIRNGDQSAAAADIATFIQAGHMTLFQNKATGSAFPARGVRVATTAGATSLGYAITSGTAGAVVPTHILNGFQYWTSCLNPGGAVSMEVFEINASGLRISSTGTDAASGCMSYWYSGIATGGAQLFMRAHDASSVSQDIFLSGWIDPVLGVGANPIL